MAEQQEIAAAEIAQALGVKVQAVTNWPIRHSNFPLSTNRRGRTKLYDVTTMADWLDQQPIYQASSEGDRTYGDRFRRSLKLPPRPADAPMAKAPRKASNRLPADSWSSVTRPFPGMNSLGAHDAGVFLAWLRATCPQPWSQLIQSGLLVGRPASMPLAADSGALRALDPRWPESAQLGLALPKLRPGLFRPPKESNGRDSRSNLFYLARALNAALSVVETEDRADEASSAVGRARSFEVLLDRLAQSRQKVRDHEELGQMGWYFTPVGLTEVMIDMVAPTAGDQVFDPCCGSGELLAAAARRVVLRGGSTVRVSGTAANERSQRTTLTHLAMQSFSAQIEGRVGRLDGELPEPSGWGLEPADVVVSNPPFDLGRWQIADLTPTGGWAYGTPADHGIEFAWLQKVLAPLTSEGRAALVLPIRATHPHHQQGQEILGNLLEAGVIRAVIELPSHLFRETSAAMSVWIFGPPRQGDRRVLILDAEKLIGGQRNHRVITSRSRDEILSIWSRWEGDQMVDAANASVAVGVSFDDIRSRGGVLAFSRHRPPLVSAPMKIPTLEEVSVSTIDLRRTLHELEDEAAALAERLDQFLDAWEDER
ncbi:N-6 DNA methylase [Kineosporia mesophila]|uniref:N-6 DNA methylase n=1 Tax=Kineosporia mesophila TaxID=566012 RepID=UPI001E5023DB|nr:SAM-dependent methyltransferase [Kineosporia mesophila]